ncbi:MAG TPA: apolipoprotein N-acyltransferase [Usitatibacteraceae bacterium]|nr:apolipoprotein N-acyltransferase [Usitatibacteraceae bacterium]
MTGRAAALRRALIEFFAGAAGVLAFAPFYLWPAALLSLGVLFAAWWRAPGAWGAFLAGWRWGMGMFLAGVSWLYVSLHVYGNMPAILAGMAILLFCGYLALFPALAGWCARWLVVRTGVGAFVAMLMVFPAMFVLAEFLRGWFLTGFPWLNIGTSQTPGGLLPVPLAGFAPLGGAALLSLLVAMVAAGVLLLSPWLRGVHASRRAKAGIAAGIAVVLATGALAGRIEWSVPSGPPVEAALVQGNIPQEIKWRAEAFERTLSLYRDLVRSSSAPLIVLPETALPGFLHDLPPEYLADLGASLRERKSELVLGVPVAERRDPASGAFRYANSAIVLGSTDGQRYDKRHLVAFGEFMPPLFSWVYRWLQIPLAGFTPGAPDAPLLRVAGIAAAVNICYEDAFGGEIAPAAREADVLINLSNMAWYGRSLAASQHAQFSQLRALETARWMLRATNTGVTAAINERGEIFAALPQFETGVLPVVFTPRRGVTPYMRWGDAPALALCAALIALAGTRAWRARAAGAPG